MCDIVNYRLDVPQIYFNIYLLMCVSVPMSTTTTGTTNYTTAQYYK